MKKLFLILALALFSITAKSQTVIATITKPGTWLVNDTGNVTQIDSAKTKNLVLESAKKGHRVWIVYVAKGSTLELIKMNDGMLFRHTTSTVVTTENTSKPESTEPEK